MAAMAVASIVASVLLAMPVETEDSAAMPADPTIVEAAESGCRAGGRCDSGHTGYYWTVNERFEGEESYAVYCDPSACEQCTGGWRPISVTIYLYWEYENACALTVRSAVTQVESNGGSHPVPGAVICESEPEQVGPFAPPGLWAVNVPLPEGCTEIDGPFFAMLTFEDTCEELPSLAADLNPCQAGRALNDHGLGWQGVCDGDFPGNLSMFATLECQAPSAAHEATWTTVKDMYRADD